MIGIIFVMSLAIPAKAQITSIRTVGSVGINPAVPMVGSYPILPVYYRWMKELAECENLPLPPIEDFSKIKFFEVNASDFQYNDVKDNAFFAVTDAANLVMFVSIAHVFDVWIMKHEFLHVLLYYAFPDHRYNKENTEHPELYFGKCGVKPN
jgi:hypothetical protein